MNRRSFTAGVAGLIPMSALATDTSRQEVKHHPEVMIRQYLNEVWMDHNLSAIDDLFDHGDPYLSVVKRQHEPWLDDVDKDRPLRVLHVTANETVAMAHCLLWFVDTAACKMFVIIQIGPSGLINGFNWMANPELTEQEDDTQ